MINKQRTFSFFVGMLSPNVLVLRFPCKLKKKKNCFEKGDKLTSECFFGQVMTSYNVIYYLKGLHVLFITCYVPIVGRGFPTP